MAPARLPGLTSHNTYLESLRSRISSDPARCIYKYLPDGDSQEAAITYAELDQNARHIAALLQQRGAGGKRVLILQRRMPDFIFSFLGCLYAQAVAVPVAYTRSVSSGRSDASFERIQRVARDSQAEYALTSSLSPAELRGADQQLPEFLNLDLLVTDEGSPDLAEQWRVPPLDGNRLAYLQYTSGSTRAPRGVMVTHRNLMSNLAYIQHGANGQPNECVVQWIPLYHDMGLLGLLAATAVGCMTVLLPSFHFVQRPLRWLQAITRYKATFSGGPNFAYDLCVSRIPPEARQDLDLSHWRWAFCGGEPVRHATMRRFAEAFAPCGFDFNAFYPCYGLGEYTLKVSGGRSSENPAVCQFRTHDLRLGKAVQANHDSAHSDVTTLVGCGRVEDEHRALIVDPETLNAVPEGTVGEIWVQGPSKAAGYWNQPSETKDTFEASLATGEGPFLRTGDLGFFHGDQLFITGRQKEVIVIHGKNYYPHDIEDTVQQCHPSLRRSAGAAFTIQHGDEKRLCVVQELERGQVVDHAGLLDAVCKAVNEHHALWVHRIVLVKPNSLPRTTSGKVQRLLCRERLIEGKLAHVVSDWQPISPAEDRLSHGGAGGGGRVTSDAGHAVPAAAPPARRDESDIKDWIADRLATILKTAPDRIDLQQSFWTFGLNSVHAVGLSGELGVWLQRDVSPLLLFEYPNIAALSEYLAKEDVGKVPADAPEMLSSSPRPIQGPASVEEDQNRVEEAGIAVIGMAGRFSGSRNLDDWWEHLRGGVDLIREIPPERWDWRKHFSTDRFAPGRIYTKWGSFLEDLDLFDPALFHISGREAQAMDPQQRILLETVWQVLEDAGYANGSLSESTTGVFVGASYTHVRDSHVAAVAAGGQVEDPHLGLGTNNAILANRVSYVFDLHGPCMTIDTLCSSSLVALHLAVQSLRRGECAYALVAGVHIGMTPLYYQVLSRLQALSPEGRCKTFDRSADGYVPGEGVGAILLKPLRHARADRDHIHGLILGSAVNHGGKAPGLTVPAGTWQAAVVREALRDARVSADSLTYLEAHGTGTTLGDPIEVEGLRRVFQETTSRRQFCAIGSVKANMGHLEPAAGIAGVLKVLLAMQAGQLPPQIHFAVPNGEIRFEDSPFYVNDRLREWRGWRGLRRAGVSSFGMGGVNAHAILQQAPKRVPDRAPENRPWHIFTLSARSQSSLSHLTTRYRGYLESRMSMDIRDVCFTMNTGRPAFSHRLAVLATNTADLATRLRDVIEGKASPPLTWRSTEAAPWQGDGELDLFMQAQLRALPASAIDALAQWCRGAAVAESFRPLREGSRPRPDEQPLRLHEEEWRSLLSTVAQLYVCGVNVDWKAIDSRYTRFRISLPTSPFEHGTGGLDAASGSVRAASCRPSHANRPRGDERHGGPDERAAGQPALSQAAVDRLNDFLRERLAAMLEVDVGLIDPRSDLRNVGLDSVLAMEFMSKLSARLSPRSPLTNPFGFSTLEELSRHLIETLKPTQTDQLIGPAEPKIMPTGAPVCADVAPKNLPQAPRLHQNPAPFPLADVSGRGGPRFLGNDVENAMPRLEPDRYREYARPELERHLRAVRLDKAYVQARGDRLWYEAKGQRVEVLDLVGGFGATLFGHNHPELVAAQQAVLAAAVPVQTQASIRGYAGMLAHELSRRLEGLTGRQFLTTVCNTGAEAIEAAMKHAALEYWARSAREQRRAAKEMALLIHLARREHVRPSDSLRDQLRRVLGEEPPHEWAGICAKLRSKNDEVHRKPCEYLALEGAFHGKTSGAGSLTFTHPYGDTPRLLAGTTAWVDASNPKALREAIEARLESTYTLKRLHNGEVVLKERRACRVAAFFVEPIQGEGGVHPLDSRFLGELRSSANVYQFPVVVDEIQTGMGRCGAFVASARLGFRGDYYTLGKSLGGGLVKISALLVERARYRADFGLYHTSTFAEDDHSALVALRALELLDRDDLARRANDVGSLLLERLRDLQVRYPDVVADVRGMGCLIGVELADQTSSPSAVLRYMAHDLGSIAAGFLLNEEGVRVMITISSPSTLRLEPSAYLTESDADRVIRAFDRLCQLIHVAAAGRLLRYVAAEHASIEKVRQPIDWRERHPDHTELLDDDLPKVAFLTHLVDAADLLRWDPSLADMSEGGLEQLVHAFYRVVPARIVGRYRVRSATGKAVELMLIGFMVTSSLCEELLRSGDTEWLRERIDDAVRLAHEEGCRMVGLGGYLSIMTRNCHTAVTTEVGLTSGNSLTVAVGCEAVRRVCVQRNMDLDRACLAVVGAGGNIGSTFARVMACEFPRMLLIGRSATQASLIDLAKALYEQAWERIQREPAERLTGLAKTLGGLARTRAFGLSLDGRKGNESIGGWLLDKLDSAPEALRPLQLTGDLSTLRGASVIVTGSSSADPIIYPEHLGPGAQIICDLAVPRDVADSVRTMRPDIHLMSGGVVRLPLDKDLDLKAEQLSPGSVFACVAETLILGLEGEWDHFSFGEVREEDVDRILALARAHGFEPELSDSSRDAEPCV